MRMRVRRRRVALLPSRGGAHAAEIDALITTAMKAAIDEIVPSFERASGHKVRVTYGPSGGLARRFIEGAPADLIAVDSNVLDGLIKQGKVLPGRTDVARTGIGIAVKKGAPKPDVSSAEALKRALVAAKSVGHTAPAGGGVTAKHLLDMFVKLGIADEVAAKTKLAAGGPNGRVSVLVSSGEAEIGLQLVSELMSNPDVEVIGLLPAELQLIATISAGITGDRQAAGCGEGANPLPRRAGGAGGLQVEGSGVLKRPPMPATIKLLCTTALKTSLDELLPQFERATGHKVEPSYGPSAQLTKRLTEGEAADAVVLTGPGFEEMAKLGKVTAGSRLDIARSATVVAVKKGARRAGHFHARKIQAGDARGEIDRLQRPRQRAQRRARRQTVGAARHRRGDEAQDRARAGRPGRPDRQLSGARRGRDRHSAGRRAVGGARSRHHRPAAGRDRADHRIRIRHPPRRQRRRRAKRWGNSCATPEALAVMKAKGLTPA